eukprot:6163751-Amphidinium_carterae.1
MLKSILNPGRASNITALRSALEKWEEQVRSYERKKDDTGAEEKNQPQKIPDSIKMATFKSLCPPTMEQHLKLNHAKLKSYDELRIEVPMLLATNVGASLIP